MIYRRLDPRLPSDRLGWRLWQLASLAALLGWLVVVGGVAYALLDIYAPGALTLATIVFLTSPIWGLVALRSARRRRADALSGAEGRPPASSRHETRCR